MQIVKYLILFSGKNKKKKKTHKFVVFWISPESGKG